MFPTLICLFKVGINIESIIMPLLKLVQMVKV